MIISRDAAENTRNRIRSACLSRNIHVVEFGNKEALGKICGVSERSTVAICGKDFAAGILRRLQELSYGGIT